MHYFVTGATGLDAHGVDPGHCTVQLQGGKAVLSDFSAAGTFLNDRRVKSPVALNVGDAIRLGAAGDTIVAIACLDRNET